MYSPSRNSWIDEFGRPLPGVHQSLESTSGSNQYRGDISVATWNSNALFCMEPIAARKKLAKVVSIARRHDVTFIQEVHGDISDARRLEDVLRETHKVFACPHASVGAGGLLTIIRSSFSGNFDNVLDPVFVEQGRVMAVDLVGPKGNCRLTNVHNDPAQSTGQQKALIRRIISEAPCQMDALHLVGGDFNFVSEGETRFNASTSKWTNGDGDIARFWAEAAQTFTEWHQDQFTRGQNCEAGFIMSRLDRIYSNHLMIDVYDACISAATIGNLHEISKLSDHLDVSASFVRKSRSPAWRSIPSWVCQHPYFCNACEDAIACAPFSGGSPVDEVLWAKQIMRNAARRVIERSRIRGARTVPEQLHWMCSFMRALRAKNHLAAFRAASAFPEIWKFAAQTDDGSIVLSDVLGIERLLCTTMEAGIDERIASVDAAKDLPEYKAGQEKSKLNEWRKQWSLKGRRKTLEAAKDEEGNVIVDPDIACSVFSKHWGNVFSPKDIDVLAANEFLGKYARRLPDGINWIVPLAEFEKLIERCTDSATGPDGLPYSAWANSPARLRTALHNLYVSLVSSDLEPGADFNYAWLLLLQKGDDPQDARVVARTAEDTRPLSASNTDCKIIAAAGNEPLRRSLPTWARDEQRGFVMTRQLIDNVIDVDTDCRIASHCCRTGAVLALFDYAAAFPSVAWLYLFLVLEFSGVPKFYIKFVKKLYTNARHYLRFLGRILYAFTPLAGTKQGCPLSGSLFVMLIDPMIALLQSRIGPRDSIRAFADDLAAVVWNMWITLPGLATAFMLIARVSNLNLKIKKTVLVPLWKCDINNLRKLVREHIPAWAGVDIKFAGKYLGFMLGPGAGDLSWSAPSDKWESRVRVIRSFGIGLFGTALQYNSHAISCMGFVSQLEHVPLAMLKKESALLQLLTRGPYNAFSKGALLNLRELGLPVSFKSLRALNLGAMYRAAQYTSNCLGPALARYNRMLECDDMCLGALTGNYLGIFERPPIAVMLDHVSRHIGFPVQLKANICVVDAEFRRRMKGKGSNSSIQKEVYKIYQHHVHPFDTCKYLTRRLARWKDAWEYFPMPDVLARRAIRMLTGTFKRPSPCVLSAVIKTLLNGWVTNRRFRNTEARHCRVGCEEGDDSIEHYAVCPCFHDAWMRFSGLPSPNGPLGFMCLADEHNAVIKLRMAFLFCVHSVLMRLQARSECIHADGLASAMRERRRFICGQSPEIRSAMQEVEGIVLKAI